MDGFGQRERHFIPSRFWVFCCPGVAPILDQPLHRIQLAPAPPSSRNHCSAPIGRGGPTTDGAAGLATGEQDQVPRGPSGATEPSRGSPRDCPVAVLEPTAASA